MKVKIIFLATIINTGVIVTIMEVLLLFKANFQFNFFDVLNKQETGGVLTLINLIIRGGGEIQPKYFDYSK